MEWVSFSDASTCTPRGYFAAMYHLFFLPTAALVDMNNREADVLARLDKTFEEPAGMLKNGSRDVTLDDIVHHMERGYAKTGISFVLACLQLPGDARVRYEMYVRTGVKAWKYFPTTFSRGLHNTLELPWMAAGEFKETLRAAVAATTPK